MPTPVSTARQCLTSEAARALDEAVGVARRRGHAQTTSLHALSAFLSLPSSTLREACSRVRSSAYSHRLQYRALELCFGASLDRLPSSQTATEEPPVSNSLMAAIKRSQANQRRHPDNFHLYQQQQQMQDQQSSFSCVKVELQQLILSILDDPIVSRVFSEAGFRSYDVKLAIVRPPPPLSRYSRSRCPPLFLCNLPGGDSDLGRQSFSFPFSGPSDGVENCKRICEVLARKERNPLLVGVCANDAVRSFAEFVERGKVGGGGGLPVEISGLSFISIEKEISKFLTENGSEVFLHSRFEELDQLMKSCSGPGIVVSFGDLKVFVDDNPVGAVNYVVSQLTRLLELHRGKMWLMGSTASYEMYSKFLMRFHSIDKDWDLHLLPITSLRPSMEGFPSRPGSLMESFVPLGGFFSTLSDMKDPLSCRYQSISRCQHCNEKYEQEVSDILKGGCTPSVSDQFQSSLPSWLQMAEFNKCKGLDVAKAKNDGAVFNAKVTGLQMKWNDICRRLNHRPLMSNADIYRVGPQVLPGIAGFPFVADGKDKADSCSSSVNASPNENGQENVFPSMAGGLQTISLPNKTMPSSVVSEAKAENSVSKLQERPPKSECPQKEVLLSPPCPLSNLSTTNYHASHSSAASVTTDLGLGTLYASTYKETKKPTFQVHKERLQDFSGCFPSKIDPNISNPSVRSSSCSGSDLCGQFDPKDFKTLLIGLTEKVGRQFEAIRAISQTIAHCGEGNARRRGARPKRDIWFSFLGPDRVAKKRIAMTLADIICGSRENLICLDLNSQNRIARTIFGGQEINGYDVKFRGKTVVDIIAEEINKKPSPIVFLENVDKADLLVQNSLSQAIKTGKFPDSRGREVGIKNAIFLITSSVQKETSSFSKELVKFSEEKIVEAQGLQIQILIGHIREDNIISNNSNVSVTSEKSTSGLAYGKKRKMIGTGDDAEHRKWTHKISKCLDLNLPIEELESSGADCGNSESDSVSENTEFWLEDILDQMDETVVFKQFDFDALANKLLKEISEHFKSIIGSEGLLEIDSKVMEHILAAAWLSDKKRAVEDWVEQVLGRSFTEAQQRYTLTAQSVLKLVTCEGLYMEEQAPGVCLPARIILN